MWACNAGSSKIDKHVNISVIKLLLEHGADVEIKDNKGYTALDYFNRLEIVSDPAREIEELLTIRNSVL